MTHTVTVRKDGKAFRVVCSCGMSLPALHLKDANRISKIHIQGEREKEKQ